MNKARLAGVILISVVVYESLHANAGVHPLEQEYPVAIPGPLLPIASGSLPPQSSSWTS